jgi:hypothetical protein
MHAGFWWGNLRQRDDLKDPVVDRITLKWVFRKWDVGGMDWIDLTEGRVR